MPVLVPTKKIPQLTAYGVPLAGPEMLEISVTNTSRRVTARDFVLPIDSVLTVVAQGATLSGSRQLTAGIGIAFIDGGAGSTLEVNATGAVAGPANPTAQVGLAAVNGVAVTYMRSDAAPALSQAISPIWTGDHSFRGNQNEIRNAVPNLYFVESDAAADNQAWPIRISGEQFNIGALNDLGSVFTPWVTVDRTGTVIDLVNLQGTTVSVNGQNVRDAAILTSGTVATARLGSGVADATTWLRGDQTWQTLPGSFTGFANPTASVGLAAVNGAATTAMRSDAAPALSQAIVPTWTAQHIFSLSGATDAAILASSAQPQHDWNETDAAANNRRWRLEVQGEQFLGRTVNDANSAAVTFLAVDRTLNVVDLIALTSTALTWNGNQLLSTGNAFANPTGTVGLATVNGAATTAMRSDAAPPLSQSIAPTWSAQHSYSQIVTGTTYPVLISNNTPGIGFNEADGAANNRLWDMVAASEQFLARIRLDDGSVSTSWLVVDRTGSTVDTVNFANGTLQYAGAEVGLRNRVRRDFSVSDNTVAADNGKLLRFTGAGGQTFTLDSDIATGGGLILLNDGSASLTIAATTLQWWSGSAVSTGSRTLAVGGWLEAYSFGGTSFAIWGQGIT